MFVIIEESANGEEAEKGNSWGLKKYHRSEPCSPLLRKRIDSAIGLSNTGSTSSIDEGMVFANTKRTKIGEKMSKKW